MQNIQVVLRVRPINAREKGHEGIWAIKGNSIDMLDSSKQQYLARRMGATTRTHFLYDYCYSTLESNSYIYSRSVRPIVMSSFKGINGTVFMYGQTGSGKTYSMLGYDRALKKRHVPVHDSESEDEPDESCLKAGSASAGVLILALQDLFKTISKDTNKTYTVKCSYVQIYNENVYDLLSTSKDKFSQNLQIYETQKKQFELKGATCISVSSIEEVIDVIRKGEHNRHYAQTAMNHRSSRSHTIFRLFVHSFTNQFVRSHRAEFSSSSNVNNREMIQALIGVQQRQGGTLVTQAILNFVDLAGSQKIGQHSSSTTLSFRQKKSVSPIAKDKSPSFREKSKDKAEKMQASRLQEGKSINKSLFFLMQVISLKAEGKSAAHIPYRNSSLTKILRGSLGGNARTLILLCVAPCISQVDQSLSTMRFGATAKRIQNWVQANIQTHNDEGAVRILVYQYEKKIQDLQTCRINDRQKIKLLKRQIAQGQTAIKEVDKKQSQQYAKDIQSLGQKNFALRQSVLNLEKVLQQRFEIKEFGVVKATDIVHVDQAGALFAPQFLRQPYKKEHSKPKQDSSSSGMVQFLKRGMTSLRLKCESYQKQIQTLRQEVTQYFSNVYKTLETQKIQAQQLQKQIQYLQERDIFLSSKSVKLSFKNQIYQKGKNLGSIDCQPLLKLQEMLEKSLNRVKKQRISREVIGRLSQLNPNMKIPGLSDKPQSQINIFKDFRSQINPLDVAKLQQTMITDKKDILAQLDRIFQRRRLKTTVVTDDSMMQTERWLKNSTLPKKTRNQSAQELTQIKSNEFTHKFYLTQQSRKPFHTQQARHSCTDSEDNLFKSVQEEITSVVSKVLGFQKKKKSHK